LTAKRRVPTSLERFDDPLDAAVHSQAGCDQRAHCYDRVEQLDVPPLGHEAAHPALGAVVMPSRAACCWIKAFVFSDGVALDVEAEHEQWREGVCELHDTERGDEAGEGAEMGRKYEAGL
jgi:hypothetical protein